MQHTVTMRITMPMRNNGYIQAILTLIVKERYLRRGYYGSFECYRFLYSSVFAKYIFANVTATLFFMLFVTLDSCKNVKTILIL